MKIVSFNINSIRARPHQLEFIRDTIKPDIIGLQETKVHNDEYPIDVINDIGYHSEYWGQKGHYGVALLSLNKPVEVVKGFKNDTDEDQKRFIQAKFKYGSEEIIVMNGYFPQGENRSHETKFPKKVKYYGDLKKHIKNLQKSDENLIVMGDFNVAPTDIDIGIGENNKKRWLKDGKCAFLPEEIKMWNSIKDLGFSDSWREQHPNESSIYSWFDYRSRMFEDNPKRGLRIDHILLSKNLTSKLVNTGICYKSRALEKPSDHCPVWVEIT